MCAQYVDPDVLAEAIVREVGPKIVLGLPLGIGKATHVANALFARAAADPSVELTIFTALTLERPRASSALERRFLEPFANRVFAGYPELSYAAALRGGALPPNVKVNEFFLVAGKWLSVPAAQQHYISANYTHAASTLLDRGVNVIGQLVAKRIEAGEPRYSLSGNTDLTLDLLAARGAGKARFILVGQVNSELPFMPGDGDLSAETFSHILESRETDFALFAPPKEPVDAVGYAVGLQIARLVPDGGTLQLGIGQEADAVAHGLILRHQANDRFRQAVAPLPQPTQLPLHDAPFETGLYGLSEMLVDVFLPLIRAGVIKRRVDNALVHAAFFLGPRAFYRELLDMSDADLEKIRMCAISFTNQLYGDEMAKRRGRTGARFINNAMMVSLLGETMSDTLANGRVVSGPGGQHDFFNQAFALDDARAIIAIRATRSAHGRVVSNIVWGSDHATVPRHMRDIVVSEYGVADLRGKTDRDAIVAMLAIADSRFQADLLARAKAAGKIEKPYDLPSEARQNTPERVRAAVKPSRDRGWLPPFPFGTDFTEVEQRLLPALDLLKQKSASPLALAALLLHGSFAVDARDQDCLERMGLAAPRSIRDRLSRWLIQSALHHTREQA